MPGERKVGIRRLKNEASRIVEEVRERGERYVVTRRGEPVAVIRPWDEDDAREERVRRAELALARLRRLALRIGEAAGAGGAAGAVSAGRR